ncbi:hypothetical protein [Paraburkholderia kururiensis]|uniref:hypothetical protein n=1 Tax=Paraburkholderia kururiensis TaxID=984307 RepID=UPI003B8A68DC
MIIQRGAHGALHLLTELDGARQVRRAVRLEATVDGQLLLTDADLRRPGGARARRFVISPAELIAVIRRHGLALEEAGA